MAGFGIVKAVFVVGLVVTMMNAWGFGKTEGVTPCNQVGVVFPLYTVGYPYFNTVAYPYLNTVTFPYSYPFPGYAFHINTPQVVSVVSPCAAVPQVAYPCAAAAQVVTAPSPSPCAATAQVVTAPSPCAAAFQVVTAPSPCPCAAAAQTVTAPSPSPSAAAQVVT